MDKMSDRFGGRNKLVIAGVVFLVGLAFLIAGAVMLGVGIHKAKTQPACGPASTDTTTAASAGTGSTVGISTATTTKPSQPTGKVTPYYVTVNALNISPQQLASDYSGSVKQLQTQIQQSLPGQPIVSLLSLTVSSSAANAPNVPVGLVAIVYPDDTIKDGQVKAALNQAGKTQVDDLQNGNNYQYPPNPNDQLCQQGNPGVVTGSPISSVTTTPSGPTAPMTSAGTTPFSIAPPGDYTPCFARVVFAVDETMNDGNFRRLKNFLINEVFAGNWNHLERLALAGISNRLYTKQNFGDLSDDGDKNLGFLQKFINSWKSSKLPYNLLDAFQSLNDDFNADNYGEVHYVVFVGSVPSSNIDQLSSLANKMNEKGQFTLIGVGGNILPNSKILEQITKNNAYWTDPSQPFPGDWNSFFWQTAYKCTSPLPSPPPTIGSVGTVTVPPTTVTTPAPPTPCAGRFVVIVDTSQQSLDINAYMNEISFVNNTLFRNSFFSRFDRLAVGMYNSAGLQVTDFGVFKNANNVSTWLTNSIIPNGDGNLRIALSSVGNQLFVTAQGPRLVVLIFISKIDDEIVEHAKQAAQKLYDNNVRIVLVGLSSTLDRDKMKQITGGDDSTAVNWDATLSKQPSDFTTLFTKLWCSSTTESSDFLREKREIAEFRPNAAPLSIFDDTDYPCPGNIIFVTDLANDLTKDNFDKEVAFLQNQVFAKPWTQLDRLALITYSQHSSLQSYESFKNVAQVIASIGLYNYYDGDAPLMRAGIQQIVNNQLSSVEHPAHAIVFVASIDQSIVDKTKVFTDQAKEQGCTFTFVATGSSVDVDLLHQLSDNVITWDIDNKDAPDNWEQQFWTAYGCTDVPPTQSTAATRRTRATRPPTSTAPPVPFVPCDDDEGIQINIFLDISTKNLSPDEFNTILNFLKTQLFNYWTHFERLVIGYYSRYMSLNEPGKFNNLADVITTLNNQVQDWQAPSLLRLLISLINTPVNQIPGYKQLYIVFVTEVSDQTVNVIKKNMTRLDGKITFVTLKDVNIDNVEQLSPSYIPWPDLNQPAPVDWNTEFWAAYDCSGDPPTTSSPLTFAPTQPTQPGAQTTTTVAPTTSATPQTTKLTARTRLTIPTTLSTTVVPYIPCQKFIGILYDNSASVPDATFDQLKDFLANTLFPPWTHYERLIFTAFNQYISLEQPGASGDLDAVKAYMDNQGHIYTPPSLRVALQSLSNPTWETPFDQTFIVFISQLTDKDVKYATSYANMIKQYARLVLVGITTDVTQDRMNKLTDYSFNLDLNNVPSDILDTFKTAYGC